MTKKQKHTLVRIIFSGVIFAALMVFEHTVGFEFVSGDKADVINQVIEGGLFLIPFLIVGYDIILKAVRNITKGQVFDENFLMIVASIGAYGVGEYSEAAAVMLFFQVGELFQSYAVGKSRQSISDLMNIVPEYANVETETGIEQVDPDDVELESTIVIKPGEKVPLDSIVIEGQSYMDTSALTGESVPRKVSVGEEVISGCINGAGTLRCRTIKTYDDSTVTRILELVENASSKKSETENFITRFARYYTPIVTIAAVLLAIIPSLITGDWMEWVKRACTFLVISCPCALVISVPMGFFGGIGAAARIGVLVKGSNFLEAVSYVDTICFDKTGTLTKGEFAVNEVVKAASSEEEILAYAAKAEEFSTHPIAISIVEAFSKKYPDSSIKGANVSDLEEIAGQGISASVNNHSVLVGNSKLMANFKVDFTECDLPGTVCYVAIDESFAGAIVIADSPKSGIVEALNDIRKSGVSKCVMLTGDRAKAAAVVAKQVGVDEFCSDLFPQDKVTKVEEYITKCTKGKKLAFVGDGINDAPVLSRADVGIAMGSMGSDAAIEAADVVIMDDDISKISAIVRISRKTIRIVKENIVFALGVKGIVLLLGALGIANMWFAVFADVGVAILAILNSMRTLATK